MRKLFVFPLVLVILSLRGRELGCNGDTHLGGCSESDRSALVDFKNGLQDPENRLSSWRGRDYCKWRGVRCNNSTEAVISVDLRNPYPITYEVDSTSRYGSWNLSGQIDPSLLRLKSLRHLDLSFNTFQFIPIPEFLGSLKELRYLNLSNAGFMGAIPHNLGNLSSLKYLDLSSDRYYYPSLTADNLQWVARIGNLRQLSMNGVHLSMLKPGWVGVLDKLPFLSELHLSSCNLFDLTVSPSSVNFTSLAVVSLRDNSFITNFPEWLVNVSSLVSVDLSSNWFYGQIPLGISELPRLRSLILAYNNNLTADSSRLFKGSWRRIELLDLAGTGVHGKLPASVGNMTSLVDLNLNHIDLEGEIPSSIGNLCNLRTLNLFGNNLTGSLPELLEGSMNCVSPFPNLRYLSLSSNRLVGKLPEWLGQVENLDELRLNDNLLQGPIPASFGKLQHLTILDLKENELNGTLPETLGQLSKLDTFDVSFNLLTGIVSETHFSNLSNLTTLYFSSNSLILNVSSNWVPPFQVSSLGMGSCQLGPLLPSWLKTQKEVTELDFSNSSISGAIPNWFWDLSDNLSGLNVSFNQLQGQLPSPLKVAPSANVDFSSNLLQGPIPLPASEIALLDLSNNQFSGPIPTNIIEAMPELGFLSLSGNCISGEIPSSIGKISLHLDVLDLSRNNLEGSIPPSLGNCSDLMVLDLGRNNLSGLIPRSFGQLKHLETLHLSDNKLSGEILLSLRHFSRLDTLDLGNNKFSGKIPSWIGESFPVLRILRLRSNDFSGIIPSQLTNLSALQVLDLADNNLVGRIPDSLRDLKAMAHVRNVNQYLSYAWLSGVYYENLVVATKGLHLEYTKTLSLVTCIDLSANSLDGEIPKSITELLGLMILNLSRNHITGLIPERISALRELSSLDVSNNQLSGAIPPSMVSLTSLEFLNLSNNNFSGRIPAGGQMETFNESSYSGNLGLCGIPLESCSSEDPTGGGTVNEDDSGNDFIDQWFYLSVGLGFAAGLLVPCAILAMKRNWSYAYFNFLDRTIERILTKRNSRATHHRNRHRL